MTSSLYHLKAVKKEFLREAFLRKVKNYRFYIKSSIEGRCEDYARDALHDLGGLAAVW